MGKQTADGISWTDLTHNLWKGCWKISEGCLNCYAAEMDKWLSRGENWHRAGPRHEFKDDHYRRPYQWQKAAAAAGEIHRTFVGSVMDVLEIHPVPEINAMMDRRRAEFFNEVVPNTPNLLHLLLTKRIESAAKILPWMIDRAMPVPSNVWIGTTAENDLRARERISLLKQTRAAGLYVSYEPAIGDIDWRPHLPMNDGDGRCTVCGEVWEDHECPAGFGQRVNLVIFGDESGRRRRDADLEWARNTRDACLGSGTLFHFKQWCGTDAAGLGGDRVKKKIHLPILDGHRYTDVAS